MKIYSLYSLYEKNNPEKIKFIGITSQTLSKRISDIIACSKLETAKGFLIYGYLYGVENYQYDRSDQLVKFILSSVLSEKQQLFVSEVITTRPQKFIEFLLLADGKIAVCAIVDFYKKYEDEQAAKDQLAKTKN